MGERVLGVLFFSQIWKDWLQKKSFGRENVREENMIAIRKGVPCRK